MQHSNNSTKSKKPWYQRSIEMGSLWKLFSKSAEIPRTKPSRTSLWRRSVSKSSDVFGTNSNKQKLGKCTSLKAATSLTRVCLCAPISPYTEVVFQSEIPPRRSYTYPRAKTTIMSVGTSTGTGTGIKIGARMEGRKFFRGKSLRDDVLMRRFVMEEEAMMQVRRRNQMEIIRKRAAAITMRRKMIGPSRLSKMVLAEEESI